MHDFHMVGTLAFICHCVFTLTISPHQRFSCFVISFSAAISVPYSVCAVPQEGVGDRHLATVLQRVEGHLRGGGGFVPCWGWPRFLSLVSFIHTCSVNHVCSQSFKSVYPVLSWMHTICRTGALQPKQAERIPSLGRRSLVMWVISAPMMTMPVPQYTWLHYGAYLTRKNSTKPTLNQLLVSNDECVPGEIHHLFTHPQRCAPQFPCRVALS